MAQNFFANLSAPELALLDQNFTELYQFRGLFSTAGGRIGLGGPASATSALKIHGDLELGDTEGRLFSNTLGSVSSAAPLAFESNNQFSWRNTAGTEYARIDGAGGFRPGVDNAQALGGGAMRWAVVYSGTGTINTSDGREKTAVRAMSSAEVLASRDLAREIGAFQFLAMVAEKGAEQARMHLGMTVQRAIEIMQGHGLQPMHYAFVCYDEWPETVLPARTEQRETGLFDAQGNPVLQTVEIAPAQTIPGGNRYGFRTDELLLFIARGLEARLTALEAAAP